MVTRRSRAVIFALLYAALAFTLIYIMTSGGPGVSYDSENYLVMAERFTLEQWSRTFNPVWPPLYPLIIAAIKVLGTADLVDAARLVSIFCYLLLIVAVYRVGVRLRGELTGHLAAISALFFAPIVYVYSFCWSETLYTLLSILFFLTLIPLIQSPEQGKTKYLVLSAIFAGLASVTRYVGFSLIGTGILAILLLSYSERKRERLRRAGLFALVAAVPVFLHYFACFLNYGLAGKTQFPSKYTFWHQLFQLFFTLYRDFLSFDLGFWQYTYFFQLGPLSFWLKILLLTGTTALVLLFVFSLLTSRASWSFFKPHLGMLFYLIMYCSIILYVGSTVAIDPMGSRFTVPLYPLILLLAFSAAHYLCSNVFNKGAKAAAFLLTGVCAVLFWGIQITSTASIHKGIDSGSFPTMEQPGNLNRESLAFLRENADSNDVIITNIPRKLSFIWPRQAPYADIGKEQWQSFQSELLLEASRRSIYVLICTEDFAPLGISVDEIEQTNRQFNLFSSQGQFGSDLVFKTRRVVFRDQPGTPQEE
jgi:4-amino-4-deoxy-L-arabinose transferase-like glycosyltransferase